MITDIIIEEKLITCNICGHYFKESKLKGFLCKRCMIEKENDYLIHRNFLIKFNNGIKVIFTHVMYPVMYPINDSIEYISLYWKINEKCRNIKYKKDFIRKIKRINPEKYKNIPKIDIRTIK